jgi:hypothetical protein
MGGVVRCLTFILICPIEFYAASVEGICSPSVAGNEVENAALKIIVDAEGNKGRPGEVCELYFKEYSTKVNLAENIYSGVQAGEYFPAPGTVKRIDDKTLRFSSDYLRKGGEQLPLATEITYTVNGNCLNVRFGFTANGRVKLLEGLEADFDLTRYDDLAGFTNGALDFFYNFDAAKKSYNEVPYFLNQRFVARGEPGSITFVIRDPFESNVKVADTKGPGGYFTFVFFDHEEPQLELPGPDYHSVLPEGFTFHREIDIYYDGDIGDDTPLDPRTAVYFSPHREGADGTIMFLWDEIPSPPQPGPDEWDIAYSSEDEATYLSEAVRTLEEHPAIKYIWLITPDFIGWRNYQDYYVDDVPDPTWANYHSTARLLDWAPQKWKTWVNQIEDSYPSYEWMSRVALGNHGYHHTTSLDDVHGHEFIFYDDERDNALYDMIIHDINGLGLNNRESTFCVRFPGVKYTYSALKAVTANNLKFYCNGKRYETYYFSHYAFPNGELWGINTSWCSDYRDDWPPEYGRPFSYIQYTLDRKKPTLFGGHFTMTWRPAYPESGERFDSFLDRIETEYPGTRWEFPQDFVPFIEEMVELSNFSSIVEKGRNEVANYVFSFDGSASSGETLVFEDASLYNINYAYVDRQLVSLYKGKAYSYVILPKLSYGNHVVIFTSKPIEYFDFLPEFVEAYVFPNPADRSVTIRAVFDEPLSILLLRIYNIVGELIWSTTQFDSHVTAYYTYETVWDLTASNGAAVASGVYLCVWTAELSGVEKSKVFKLAVVK